MNYQFTDDPIRVGDVIELDGSEGKILRATVIADWDADAFLPQYDYMRHCGIDRGIMVMLIPSGEMIHLEEDNSDLRKASNGKND